MSDPGPDQPTRGPWAKMSEGPLHYDKQTVGNTKYCLKSCIPECEWSRQKPLSLSRFCTWKLVNQFCYIESTEQVWFYAHQLIIQPILTHCGPEVIFKRPKRRK